MSMEYTKKEPHRTSEKNALSISDRGRDEGLKKFLRLASQLLGTHGSYITVLTDEQHIVRASYNIELQDSSREQALCRHVVEGGATVVVTDTCRDARFAHHPLITHAPFIRFYVGTPLKNKNGLMLGTLCVTDTVPRPFDNLQKNIFESLAALVIAFLDAWHLRLLSNRLLAWRIGNVLFVIYSSLLI
ncbi:UNVERIFIED_ORG: GAF domain-containing protein [Pantoea agglomerans]